LRIGQAREPRPAGSTAGAGGRAECADPPEGRPLHRPADPAQGPRRVLRRRAGDVAMSRKLPVVLAALALGGTALFVPWSSAAAAGTEVSPRELFAVRRDDLDISITENGTIVAKDSQKVLAKINGEAKITFLVEEGKNVAEGEVVCRLDTKQV